MDKKYELVKEDYIIFNGHILFRIRALKDFQTIHGLTVKVGDLGGYIQSEKNLSQEGDCWIGSNAKVYDNVCVSDNAYVNAYICNDTDYLYVKGFGTSSYGITFYKRKDNHIEFNCNFFTGVLDEFISYFKSTDENTKFGILNLVKNFYH